VEDWGKLLGDVAAVLQGAFFSKQKRRLRAQMKDARRLRGEGQNLCDRSPIRLVSRLRL
jgi:hypothetical protein